MTFERCHRTASSEKHYRRYYSFVRTSAYTERMTFQAKDSLDLVLDIALIDDKL